MNTGELKQLAKQQMKGKLPVLIFTNIIFTIFNMIIPIVETITKSELSMIPEIILMILVQPLFLGIAYIHYTSTQNNSVVKFTDIFYGYKENLLRQGVVYLVKSMITYLMTSSLVALTSTIFVIFRPSQSLIPMIMAVVIFVPSFILQAYFSQIYYIMVGNKELKGTEVLRDGLLMMRGRLVEYVILIVSFVPWLILEICTFRLASIWVNPYKNQTLANYYFIVSDEYYKNIGKKAIA